jgi:hypothetical protein
MRQALLNGSSKFVYGFLLWMTALWLGWLVLASVNFLYPLAYQGLDIGATLHTYVPQNRFGKQDYPVDDVAQHVQHFAAISHAIHAQGAGLAELAYHDAQGKFLGRLLTKDEVLHLQDVAHLVSAGMLFGALMTLLWLVWLGVMAQRGWRLPSVAGLLGGSSVFLVTLGTLLWLSGFQQVFYALHRWIFPADHAWFFYYQDSLMSSLMQAPNLFAVIGVAWLFLSIVLLFALHAAGKWSCHYFTIFFSKTKAH